LNPQTIAQLLAAGRGAEALAGARAAVKAQPANPTTWGTLGAVLVQLGDPVEGESVLGEALRLAPDVMETRFNLALAAKHRGDFATARARFEEILRRWPQEDSARFELAGVLVADGAEGDALAHLEALVAKFPGQPQVLAHLAAAQAGAGRAAEAAKTCDALLASGKAGAGQVASVAYTLATLGRVDESLAAARRAIAMSPNSIDVRSIAAGALAHAGNAAEAQPHFAAVALHRPRVASAWRKLGLAALAASDAPSAVEAFRRQVELSPTDRGALSSLGSALNAADRYEEAIPIFQRGLEAGYRDASMLAALVHTKITICDWQGLDALETELRAAARAPSRTPAHPQTALYIGTDPAEQRDWAENWARVEFATPFAPLAKRTPREGRRLRVGYLSADFYSHATSYLMAAMLEEHDRGRFEVFAYSTAADDGSATRRRIESAVEHFVDIQGMPAHHAARRIAADSLDVLVELGGYVKNSAMGLLALRPAPVQVHFLGYAGTIGAPFVDYLIADGVVAPEGGEANFTERILRMPHCYQPNDPRRALPQPKPRSAYGLPDDALVLCSFNQAMKYRPESFARWCALLQALPGAVLWLPATAASVVERLRGAVRSHGVDPSRLVFAPHVPQDEHIARVRHADIAIDTFPYTSHTTASDALWAGVPLVTTRGETFASRVATSILRAAGFGEWAFGDADRAFEATVALARDRAAREQLRSRIAAGVRASPLFDAAAFARAFEAHLEHAAGGSR
jgi:protein O-GlcNAc transferase